MATNASEDKDIIYFPIDQGEQAKQAKPEYLLARPVYERIAGFLKESLDKTIDSFSSDDACLDLDEHRAHNAILLDGGRGTGKSTILVNLSTYASTVSTERTLPDKSEAKLADFLLILKPVDPTLLENDDDLFLNIIVAALLRNKEVKDATQDYEKSKNFYARLQALGSALEGTQKQKSEFGMDKLRAFIGNHSVSDEVHKLFYEALKITGKKLILLPIDDVDTSLQHAFNNLEVVRRYLASPYVVPIISGDLDLFHEVIWRNFFEGLTSKANGIDINEAKLRAKNLAIEYERKLLSVARRILVPDFMSYVNNERVYFSFKEKSLETGLIDLIYYLNRIHNNFINNFENSFVDEISFTVRSFSQFVVALRGEFLELFRYVAGYTSDSFFKEPMFVRCEYLRSRKDKKFLEIERSICVRLIGIFKDIGEEDLFLFYDAQNQWFKYNEFMKRDFFYEENSIFCVSLFQPLSGEQVDSLGFEYVEGLRAQWAHCLRETIVDQSWFDGLPNQTVLSYPVPDKGIPILGTMPLNSSSEILIGKIFICSQVYLQGNNGVFVYFGRLFEILVLSLFEDFNGLSIDYLLKKAPFYSLISFSGTKAIRFPKFSSERIRVFNEINSKSVGVIDDAYLDSDRVVTEFAQQVSKWRKDYGGKWPSIPSTLFIYRVMNKFFTQLEKFESESEIFDNLNSIGDIANLGLRAFNAFCAAIGSFEQSNLAEISSESGFAFDQVEFQSSELYRANIGNLHLDDNGNEVGEIRYARVLFHKHPLKEWLRSAVDNARHSRTGC